MTANAPHFLLVGNGPFSNRGCEAIVRGTMEILQREFGDDVQVALASFGPPPSGELDARIHPVPAPPAAPRWSAGWWRRQGLRLMGRLERDDEARCDWLGGPASLARAALQVGGDNYSLDYGTPATFLAIDRYLHARGVPVLLWGASVGPFERHQKFAARMIAHLRGMTAILVRERESYDYLRTCGIDTNLHLVADPAFVMLPSRPRTRLPRSIPEDSIGINLSPLMAKYVSAGDMREWVQRCVRIVEELADRTKRPLVLIPHVTNPGQSDLTLLRDVWSAVSDRRRSTVFCLESGLSAAETKWAIGHCAAFVGARTHATIASLSSGVPTISLAYSRKARGINQDIFGTQDFCLSPKDIFPETVAERVVFVLENRAALSRQLRAALPGIEEAAYRAGPILRARLGIRPTLSKSDACNAEAL